MTGLVELKTATAQTLIVVLEEDSRTLALIQGVLGPEGDGFPLRHVRDRVAVQLLLRRHPSAVVLMALDSVEQEGLFQALRDHAPPTTRFIGIRQIDDEDELARLDALGLDGVLHRPLSESDLKATVRHIIKNGTLAAVS